MSDYIITFLIIILSILLINQIYIVSVKCQKLNYIFTTHASYIYKLVFFKYRKKLHTIHTYNSTNKIDNNIFRITYGIYDSINKLEKEYNYLAMTHQGIYNLIIKDIKHKHPKIKILYTKKRKSRLIEKICFKISFNQIRDRKHTTIASKEHLFDYTYFIIFTIR